MLKLACSGNALVSKLLDDGQSRGLSKPGDCLALALETIASDLPTAADSNVG
jgi:hypothetical protein